MRAAQRGFTLVELLVVFAIVAVGIGLVTWALPDGDASKLEEEGARLGALLEMARSEARAAGVAVRWVPRSGDNPGASEPTSPTAHFSFLGLPRGSSFPQRWLDERTRAQLPGARFVVLGPEALLPPQRIVLRLGEQQIELVSDGLGPFVQNTAGAEPGANAPPQGRR